MPRMRWRLSFDPADYEDQDEYDIALEYFHEELTRQMNLHNKEGYWKAVGHNMGWRKLSGYKYIEASTGEDLLREICPNTEWSITIMLKGKGFQMIIYHHDAPTGEYYEVRPITASTYHR